MQTDSEGQRKALADVQLPAADRNRVDVSSAAVERSKGSFRGTTWQLLSASRVNQFWKSKVKEALTAATLLFFYLYHQLQEQNRRNILSPLLRIRYFSLPDLLHYHWQKSCFFMLSAWRQADAAVLLRICFSTVSLFSCLLSFLCYREKIFGQRLILQLKQIRSRMSRWLLETDVNISK